jgi:primosomal protein N' (replication factor Y)
MAQILVRDRRRDRAEERSHELGRALAADPLAREVRVFGPASAPLERLRGEWRFQLLLRGPSGSRLRALLRRALPEPLPPGVVVDIDPYELL